MSWTGVSDWFHVNNLTPLWLCKFSRSPGSQNNWSEPVRAEAGCWDGSCFLFLLYKLKAWISTNLLSDKAVSSELSGASLRNRESPAANGVLAQMTLKALSALCPNYDGTNCNTLHLSWRVITVFLGCYSLNSQWLRVCLCLLLSQIFYNHSTRTTLLPLTVQDETLHLCILISV